MWPLLVLVDKAASTSIKCTPAFWRCWYLTISGILFCKVSCPTPSNFGKILRALFCYWGFPFGRLCLKFLDEAPKLSATLMTVSAWTIFSVPSDILGGLCYFFCVAYHPTARLGAFLWDYCLLVPCATGTSKLLEGMLWNCKRCPRKSYPCLLVLLFHYGEGIDGVSSILSGGISCVVVFTLILQRKRELNRVKEKEFF